MPVHPWQWQNKLVYTFAGEIASRRLLYLGFGQDSYQAQQSIRTLFNRDAPQRCYVKGARCRSSTWAFPAGCRRTTCAVRPRSTTGSTRCCATIPVWRRPASASCARSPSSAIGIPISRLQKNDACNKMLAALWRESPVNQIADGQRLMTMAALLHRDDAQQPALGALIESSPLSTRDWIARYLDAYMSPLLHCFFAHDLVFMPHGENIILVLEDNVPVRAIMKDIAEEVGTMNTDVALPGEVARLAVHVPEELKALSLFTDLFDLIFRYIADILHTDLGYDQQAFWQQVADCIRAYQQAHPQYADKFERYDLFAPEFARSCVNRLQLFNNRQLIDLADPTANLQLAGTLGNPIAAFRPGNS